MEKLDEPFYVIREQVSVLLRVENSFVDLSRVFSFCLTRGGLVPFAGWPSNLGLSMSDRAA